MRKVSFIDATALHNLEILITSSQSEGIHIVLSGVKPNVHESLVRAGIDKLIGEDHICDHIDKAVVMANKIAKATNA
jgi:SulP family sulfate permease